jgi:hypothetical protein
VARRCDVQAEGVSERAFDREDTRLLFEVLFDIKRLIADILMVIEGGDDDGEEEETGEVDE